MDLLKQINTKIAEFNAPEDAAKFFGVTKQTLGKFQSGSANLPIHAIQKVVDALVSAGRLRFDAPASKKAAQTAIDAPGFKEGEPGLGAMDTPGEGKPAPHEIANPENLETAVRIVVTEVANLNADDLRQIVEVTSTRIRSQITLGVPFVDRLDVTGPNLLAIAGNTRNFRCAKLRVEKGFTLEGAMNKLAKSFLADTPAEWLFYMHPETFVPFGNPDWFAKVTKSPFSREYTGANALERMCSNRDNRIVGAVYACPQGNGKNAIQPEVDGGGDPANAELARLIREGGPQNKLLEVPWVGIRAMAVHRKALEEIMADNPDIVERLSEGTPFPFFAPTLDQFGADKRFGTLAKKAKQGIKLDLAIHCVPWAIQPVIAPTGREAVGK